MGRVKEYKCKISYNKFVQNFKELLAYNLEYKDTYLCFDVFTIWFPIPSRWSKMNFRVNEEAASNTIDILIQNSKQQK